MTTRITNSRENKFSNNKDFTLIVIFDINFVHIEVRAMLLSLYIPRGQYGWHCGAVRATLIFCNRLLRKLIEFVC